MLRRVTLGIGVALAGCATAPRSVVVVPFVTGAPVFPLGDGIEIEEIAGTRPRLEVGGVYFRDPDRPFRFGGVQRVDVEPADARR
jgi:hypothetical protein